MTPLQGSACYLAEKVDDMLSANQARFLKLCGEYGVRALVIGGQALVARGIPRTTVDLDLLVAGVPEDAEALSVAWRVFDPACDFDAIRKAASKPRQWLFHDLPGRRREIDVLTSVDGISFLDAYARADELVLHGVRCSVAAVTDLVAMKRVSREIHERDSQPARAARDSEDIAMLERSSR